MVFGKFSMKLSMVLGDVDYNVVLKMRALIG